MAFADLVDRLNRACVRTFGVAATLDGVAIEGILDQAGEIVLDGVVAQAPAFLARSSDAAAAAAGQSLVVSGTTYTVRHVTRVPPDGTMTRLVLAVG